MKNCIVLKEGVDGVVTMLNAHVKTRRSQMLITKTIDLKGPISIQGSVVSLGYNEVINCSSEITAQGVFDKLTNLFS